jgi:hypothetical protein
MPYRLAIENSKSGQVLVRTPRAETGRLSAAPDQALANFDPLLRRSSRNRCRILPLKIQKADKFWFAPESQTGRPGAASDQGCRQLVRLCVDPLEQQKAESCY